VYFTDDSTIQKLTLGDLELLIEEVRAELKQNDQQLTEANPYHDKTTGKLSSGKKGNVYSISKRAQKKLNIDKKYANRGVLKKARKKGEDPEPILKKSRRMNYGKTTAAGRQDLTGNPLDDPTYYVSKYKKKYGSIKEALKDDDTSLDIPVRDLLGAIIDKFDPETIVASDESWRLKENNMISVYSAVALIVQAITDLNRQRNEDPEIEKEGDPLPPWDIFGSR